MSLRSANVLAALDMERSRWNDRPRRESIDDLRRRMERMEQTLAYLAARIDAAA